MKETLNGLHESALILRSHFQATLVDIGLFHALCVNCLYRNGYLIALLCVNDIMLIHHQRNGSKADHFEQKLMEKYKIKVFGQTNHFLGIRVVRNKP